MYRKYAHIHTAGYPVLLLTGKVRVSRFNWQCRAAFWRQIGNFTELSHLFV